MDQIEELLTRGVENIYPSRTLLEKVLRSGKKLRLYQGFDPTGTQFHIGHLVGLRKLRQWQDHGHHVIFLIGDGTGLAGDPSGKTRSRERFLTTAELRKNAKDYVLQAAKVVRFDGPNPAEILYNGDWLRKLDLEKFLDIAGRITLSQMIERDLYQERLKSGEPLSLREFLYPLLQGYDSVAMDVDLEQGGTDQTFNMLMGRHLVKSFLKKEKFVMTVPLLTDSKGVKIGKSEGNVIGITDPPDAFFGKIMALSDDAIIPCYILLTDMPQQDIDVLKQHMDSGMNPMTYKLQLAHLLTATLHSGKDADAAQKEFGIRYQTGDLSHAVLPSVQSGDTLIATLIAAGIASSNSAARRLIIENAVRIHDKPVDGSYKPKSGDIIKVGRKAVKII